jgi:transposase InsO family protein
MLMEMREGNRGVEELKKQKIGLFRFRVIAPLIGLGKEEWGKKERIVRDISAREWEIPYSGRSYIGRSTVLEWLRMYEDSGEKLESLYPRQRSDRGGCRSMDEETQRMLINLKRELGAASVPTILRVAGERGLLPADFKASRQSVYRLFKRSGVGEDIPPKDRRRFEAELPNDLWQSDCMHGPKVEVEGKLRKSFLFAFIDDHSRLIPHAQFYLRENLESFLDCFRKALEKRGVPRKLYVDNAASYRAHQLAHVAACLGIALIHSTPYEAEGRGKIERWIKTVRMQFLPTLPENITLQELNARLWQWIDKGYHLRVHGSIKQKPLDRYLKHIQLIRAAPKNLFDYFRIKTTRKVYKDRTVSLLGKVYEAPVGLVDRRVTLLYHEKDPGRIEILYNGSSYGFLVPLNPHVNIRLKRTQSRGVDVLPRTEERVQKESGNKAGPGPEYKSGKLFGHEEKPHAQL